MSRPRLLERLDFGRQRGLILISAPAGYGKTTLAAEWLDHVSKAADQRPLAKFAWLSLDENDNSWEVFLSYFILAVRSAFGQDKLCAGTEALLNAAQSPPLEAVANSLLNELDALPQPLLLILDDYHVISDQSVQQIMTRLLRYRPETLLLLLITRVDPSLPLLLRRRAQGRLVEIRAADLRFTQVEARAVLTRAAGKDVTRETLVALEEQTEGWIIGLQLAGLYLRTQAQPAPSMRAAPAENHRLAMDFLVDEVLAQQPRPLHDFLLQTSLLNRFCAELCAAVTGVADPAGKNEQSYLAQLERANLFLVSLDDQGKWYRYHHLFQMLLQRRLAQDYADEEIAGIRQRAGAWLAEQGYVDEALRQLLAAGDEDAAVDLIIANRHAALNREDFGTLERWLRMLPDTVVAARPSLLQLKAWILRLRFKFQPIPPLLRQAEALLAAEPPTSTDGQGPPAGESSTISPEILRGERDALWSEIHFWAGEFELCLAAAESALARLPVSYFFARSIPASYQCYALQTSGQFERAVTLLGEVLTDERLQHPAFRSRMLLAAVGIHASAGDLRQAEQAARLLLDLGRSEQRTLAIAWGHYLLGFVYYHWNRLEDAWNHWSSVPELRYHVNFRPYHEAMLGLAMLQQIRGDAEGAQQTVDLLSRALLEMNESNFGPEVDAFRARLALLRGDLSAAVQWAEGRSGPDFMPSLFWEASDLTRIKVCIAQGTTTSLREAVDCLKICLQRAEAAHQAEQLIEVWALWALVEAAQGDADAALAACRRAVTLAETGGFIRLFVDLGPAMADLLRQLALSGVDTFYIGRILAAFPTDESPSLTERELEILTLLQKGFSDRRIAERLVISLNTVKKHNRNIYQKLGVTSRARAIAQATALGLL